MNQKKDVINYLKIQLNFSSRSIYLIKLFVNHLLVENKKYNLISKSTESIIWLRHILDSAQLVNLIDFKSKSLSDLGSGAGFPGLILAIFNENKDFHVKLYEKSPVKRAFLSGFISKFSINAKVCGNIYEDNIDSDYIVCRAFKKFDTIIQVSREIVKKSHKLIVLKGQNAHKDLKKSLKSDMFPYKIIDSITKKDSKIIIINFKK